MPNLDLSIGYWPARTGPAWWDSFRADECRRDFERAAALNINHLSLALTWREFQPDPDRMSLPAMRDLERVLWTAEATGLRLTPVLFPVAASYRHFLPPWLFDRSLQLVAAATEPASGGRRPIRNLVRDGRMVEAQAYQVRELVRAFTGHPAIASWIIGDRIEAASQVEAGAFEEWLGTLAESARASGAQEPLWHAVSARALVQSPGLNPACLTRLDVGLQIVDDWRAAWTGTATELWPAFLAAYAGRLTGRPCIVGNVGTPPHSRTSGEVDEDERAAAIERTVPMVAEVGAGGCSAPFLFDFEYGLRSSPPFDEDPSLLTGGVLHADGRLKPSGQVWSDLFAADLPVRPVPADFPSPDPGHRQRDPQGVARECFEALTR